MRELAFRQIHLDFHTSELVGPVAEDFDPKQFVETLKRAHVNSVTCFARCHHGWIYFYTERFPERQHPQLKCDLLRLQIEACHEAGIRVPVYITVQWDHFTAREHPEWLAIDEEGRIIGTKPLEAGFYRKLCLNSPYVDFVHAFTEEVLEKFEVDGIFFDIVHATPCLCERCKQSMLEEGLNPEEREDREEFAARVLERFQKRMFDLVKSKRPEATVFFNSGHIGPLHRRLAETFTHFELESLPSGGWGYWHMPITQRYARTIRRETLGMTGKFHTSWGDIYSLKNQAALEFECFHALALCAKCSIGDQPPPSARLQEGTYELIGRVYEQVEAVEPWCAGAEPVVDIGVLTPDEFHGTRLHPALVGAAKILQQKHHQFDVIDTAADFSRYRVLVLPDAIPVDEKLAGKLREYAEGGGAILCSHRAGLSPDGETFALPRLGLKLVGESEFDVDFVKADKLAGEVPDEPLVMYKPALRVEIEGEAEVLSPVIRPAFARTWRHFHSHRYAPPAGEAGYPAVVRSGPVIYFAHPVFTLYEELAPRWCRDLVAAAMDLLLPDRALWTDAPPTAILTVNRQPEQNRLVVHVLHYVPQRWAERMEIVERPMLLENVTVSVRVERPPAAVKLVPQGEEAEWDFSAGRVQFTLERVEGYQVVALEFGG